MGATDCTPNCPASIDFSAVPKSSISVISGCLLSLQGSDKDLAFVLAKFHDVPVTLFSFFEMTDLLSNLSSRTARQWVRSSQEAVVSMSSEAFKPGLDQDLRHLVCPRAGPADKGFGLETSEGHFLPKVSYDTILTQQEKVVHFSLLTGLYMSYSIYSFFPAI